MCFRLRAVALLSLAMCVTEGAQARSGPNATINGTGSQNATTDSGILQNSTVDATGLQNATDNSTVYRYITNNSKAASSNATVMQNETYYAETCKPYPGKRVVLVSVSREYLGMFRNWLHFAGRFLGNTEQLVAVAEDISVEDQLRRIANTTIDGRPALLPRFEVVRSSGAEALGADPNRSSLRGALLERNGSAGAPDAPHFDSQAFGDLVTQRSTHMLAYLHQGCTVLYSDIDNVWVKDPFRELARLPGKDLVATDDEPPNVTSRMYFCTCFLYVQPSLATEDLMVAWGRAAAGQRTNQRPFNAVLREAREAGRLTSGVLPASEFPPGKVASEYPNATVFHANWVSGLPKKMEFFEERGLWAVEGEKDTEEATLPQKVFNWAEGVAKNVTAWVHDF